METQYKLGLEHILLGVQVVYTCYRTPHNGWRWCGLDFPNYLADIKCMREKEIENTLKRPSIRVEFDFDRIKIRLRVTDEIKREITRAIQNYFCGTKNESCFTLLHSREFDFDENTLLHRPYSEVTSLDYDECICGTHIQASTYEIGDIHYYLVFQPNPKMWHVIEQRLLENHLPRLIVERISEPMREKISNLGIPLIPEYKYDTKRWCLRFNHGSLKIDLEPESVSDSPQKRCKNASDRKSVKEMQHEKALREISPEFFLIPNQQNDLKNGIRGPKYVTRRCYPVGWKYTTSRNGALLWTGKAAWQRTYIYEACYQKTHEFVYFRERELKLERNNQNVRAMPKTRVARQNTFVSLSSIFAT